MKHLLLATAITAFSAMPLSAQAGDYGNKHDAKAYHATQNQSIAAIAMQKEDFSTLVTALKAAGLADTFANSGSYTVFAPTNAAFDKLPEGTVANLLKPENKEQLQSLLKYHVVANEVPSQAAKGKEVSLSTLQGSNIEVDGTGSGVAVNNAKVVKADVKANNGVIHAIDTVLMPN